MPYLHRALFLLLCAAAPSLGYCIDDAALTPLVEQQNVAAIKALGEDALPNLIRLYEKGSEPERTRIAAVFYGLGWKSEGAKAVLMRDLHTQNEALRLQVQWALGRVSNDEEVVAELLKNMRNDPNPLFRDKAACALAEDQIHLTEKQKVALYSGVIDAMRDEKADVRRIAAQVMAIQTGQHRSFNPDGTAEEREAGIKNWQAWLDEYRKAVADE